MGFLSKWKLLAQCSRIGMVRYTAKARRTIFNARDQAIQEMSKEVTSEHLLVGLLRADESLHTRLAIPTIDSIRNELATNLYHCQAVTEPALSQAARHVIVFAAEERELLSHKHTGTEHLLLGLIRSGSEAAKVLEKRKITVDRVRQMLWQQKAVTLWTGQTIREPA